MTPLKTLEIKQPEIHEKAWGRELWIHNGNGFCGKVLEFNKGAKFSMHFHVEKEEAWYVSKGCFVLRAYDTDNAKSSEQVIYVGQCIFVPRGVPHQLEALEDSAVFEASTEHKEYDSYRIGAGDSQKA